MNTEIVLSSSDADSDTLEDPSSMGAQWNGGIRQLK